VVASGRAMVLRLVYMLAYTRRVPCHESPSPSVSVFVSLHTLSTAASS
jgi:hypothetical protein